MPVIERDELRRLVGTTWREAGISVRGGRGRFVGPEIEWRLKLEGTWLGSYGMVADARFVPTDSGPPGLEGYPLRVFAEALRTVDYFQLVAALRRNSEMSLDQRRDAVRQGAAALASFVLANGTLEALRKTFRTGDLDAMSVRKDLRAMLE